MHRQVHFQGYNLFGRNNFRIELEAIMLSLHEIEIFLQHTSENLQDIVLELRNIISSVTPDAVEVIR